LSPVANPRDAVSIYTVQTGEGSCTVSDTVTIRIKESDTLYFPTAFTPNGDLTNEYFRPIGIANGLSLQIYNRLGQQIFTTASATNGWDGRYKGVPQPVGVYVYLVRYTSKSGREKIQKGSFFLIR
jgi:gliding motility-associated-like protein